MQLYAFKSNKIENINNRHIYENEVLMTLTQSVIFNSGT